MQKHKDLVSFSEVRRSYNQHEVLHDLSFEIRAGDVLAMVGPNGSGKTTTIRLMLGLLRCQHGKVNILGHSAWEMPNSIRALLGVVLEGSGLDGNMSAIDNLLYYGQLQGLSKYEINKRTCVLLGQIGFDDDLKKMVNKLSKGNRQKISLIRAMLNDPKLLVLDEPTSGLDPISQRDVRNRLINFAAESNRAIFLTSHNMPEISLVANKILVIKKGKIIVYQSTPDLIEQQGYVVEVEFSRSHKHCNIPELLKRLSEIHGKCEQISATRIKMFVEDKSKIEKVEAIFHEDAENSICAKRFLTLDEIYCKLIEG